MKLSEENYKICPHQTGATKAFAQVRRESRDYKLETSVVEVNFAGGKYSSGPSESKQGVAQKAGDGVQYEIAGQSSTFFFSENSERVWNSLYLFIRTTHQHTPEAISIVQDQQWLLKGKSTSPLLNLSALLPIYGFSSLAIRTHRKLLFAWSAAISGLAWNHECGT